jgi:hypothetical protein
MAGPCNSAVVCQMERVVDTILYETILECYAYCGYFAIPHFFLFYVNACIAFSNLL